MAIYASVGERTIYNIRDDLVNRRPGRLFNLGQPPVVKLKKVANNKTPAFVIKNLVKWCFDNSSEVPNSVNVRRFNAPFTSLKKAWRAFTSTSEAMSWQTFRVHKNRHCGNVKVLLSFILFIK